MRIPSVSIPLLVLAAVCTGCAQYGSGTSTMGAGPAAQNVMCRDGAWVGSTSQCGDHGGVERVVGTPTQR